MSEHEAEYGTTENDIVSLLLDYINVTPELLSLLYDLGWCPEQLKHGSTEWCKMMILAERWHRLKGKDKITWHDPEKNPESEKSQILVVKYPEREPWWIRAWWQDNQWYSCDDGVEVPDHYIVKWGSFELEIEEVEG